MQRIVIVDIDGTLNKFSGRFKSYSPENDAENIALLATLEPVPEVISLVQSLCAMPGVIVILATARPVRFFHPTKDWLEQHSVHNYVLLMMRMDNTIHDSEVKEDILGKVKTMFKDSQIWFVIEDRQSCVDMWRSKGIVVLQPAPGGNC